MCTKRIIIYKSKNRGFPSYELLIISEQCLDRIEENVLLTQQFKHLV